jgi:hypothetical protein
MGLIVYLAVAAAGCRSDDKASGQKAEPAAPRVTFDARPADANNAGETERLSPVDTAAPTGGDIEVPILILEE